MTTKRSGFIYILLDKEAGFVKIGQSRNPQKRVKELQQRNKDVELSIVSVIPTDDRHIVEKIIHNLFISERVRGARDRVGEWYYNKGLVLEFINAISEMGLMEAIGVIADKKVNRTHRTAWGNEKRKNLEYAGEHYGATKLRV